MTGLKLEVPLAPFQERYFQLEAQGHTPTALALKAGYANNRKNRPIHGDSSRLLRALGLRPDTRRKAPGLPTHTTYATALKLCHALDMDPVDAGV